MERGRGGGGVEGEAWGGGVGRRRGEEAWGGGVGFINMRVML